MLGETGLSETGLSEAIQLEPIGNDIWVVDGPRIRFLGLDFGTRMTIIRFEGSLLIHSPVTVSHALSQQISALGEVRYIIAPNQYHYFYLSEWQGNYPEAKLYAAPGLIEKRSDIRFEAELTETDAYPWSPYLSQAIFGPHRILDEVVFFHHDSKTLILTDLILNVKTDKFNALQKLFARFDGVEFPNGGTPRLYRWLLKSKAQARVVAQTMLDWAPDQVVISHGEWFRKDGRAEIESRLKWVL